MTYKEYILENTNLNYNERMWIKKASAQTLKKYLEDHKDISQEIKNAIIKSYNTKIRKERTGLSLRGAEFDPKNPKIQNAIDTVKKQYHSNLDFAKEKDIDSNSKRYENFIQNTYQNIPVRLLPAIYKHLGIFQ